MRRGTLDRMISEELTLKRFFFVGNCLCLDYINTQIVEGGRMVDLVGGFDDLVSWSFQAQVIGSSGAAEIIRNWTTKSDAESTLQLARDFRANLRQMCERIVRGRPVPQSTIDQINDLLSHQTGHTRLRRVKGGFEKQFRAEFSKPVHLLWPVAESVCDLLCYADLSLIKRCENESCALYFYDNTKNHRRRWCSMNACGNRMKAAAHYRRIKQSKPNQERN
jgi:predicted RNA-binding Zn ribbon-like protein